jgi:outer membrane lipoprotein carrier protein
MTKPLKMRIRILILFLALLLPFITNAQKDPEAMKVLTDFSKKATEAPSVSITFKLITNDTKESSIDTISGSIILSGDKYNLQLPDNSVWSDGKTSWSYMKDVNEVTIITPDPLASSFTSKPSLLFSLYKEGYKVRLIEETDRVWTIDLYPEIITNNLIRIRLKIGKLSYDLKSAEYKTKDGIIISLVPEKYDLTRKPEQGIFVFDTSKYKGVEIIDMR